MGSWVSVDEVPRLLSKIDETTAAAWKMKARADLKPYFCRKYRRNFADSNTVIRASGTRCCALGGMMFSGETGIDCKASKDERRVVNAQ